MTVFNNVAYPLKVQRKHKQDKICELVKEKLVSSASPTTTTAIRTSSPAGSSKGWRWRAPWSWSRGLLFDEPLSNLDAKLRERMRFETDPEAARSSAGYVTHDQAEAMVMSDRVIVMESGLVAQEGVPREVYARPTALWPTSSASAISRLRRSRSAPKTGPGSPAACSAAALPRRGDAEPSQRGLGGRPAGGSSRVGTLRVAPMFDAKISRVYFVGPYTEYFLDLAGHTIRAQSSTLINAAIGQTIYGQ